MSLGVVPFPAVLREKQFFMNLQLKVDYKVTSKQATNGKILIKAYFSIIAPSSQICCSSLYS